MTIFNLASSFSVTRRFLFSSYTTSETTVNDGLFLHSRFIGSNTIQLDRTGGQGTLGLRYCYQALGWENDGSAESRETAFNLAGGQFEALSSAYPALDRTDALSMISYQTNGVAGGSGFLVSNVPQTTRARVGRLAAGGSADGTIEIIRFGTPRTALNEFMAGGVFSLPAVVASQDPIVFSSGLQSCGQSSAEALSDVTVSLSAQPGQVIASRGTAAAVLFVRFVAVNFDGLFTPVSGTTAGTTASTTAATMITTSTPISSSLSTTGQATTLSTSDGQSTSSPVVSTSIVSGSTTTMSTTSSNGLPTIIVETNTTRSLVEIDSLEANLVMRSNSGVGCPVDKNDYIERFAQY